MQKVEKEIPVMLELGYVLRYAGRYPEAREIFQAVQALLPRVDGPGLALAGVAVDEGKYDEATSHCHRALELKPSNPSAYAQLAEIQLLQRNHIAAKQSMEHALKLSSTGPAADWVRSLAKLMALAQSNQHRVQC